MPPLIRLNNDSQLLMSLMDENRQNRNILLVDLDADRDQDLYSLDCHLNVVFNPRKIRRGIVRRYSYIVGCTGATIELKALAGTVTNRTPAVKLDVNYTQQELNKRKQVFSLTPKGEAKGGGFEFKADVGAVTREIGSDVGYTASFTWPELILTPTSRRVLVQWDLQMPHVKRVTGDYLKGNLELRAICTWPNRMQHHVAITVQPNDVLFFDQKGHEINWIRSALMLWILWRRKRSVEHWDGFRAEVEEQ